MSVYETFMTLPIFSGVSKAQISQFIEKINIEFLKYKSGQTIVEAGEQVGHIKFILSGRVILESSNLTGTLRIRELRPSGIMIAGRHSFGKETYFPYTVKAYDDVSVFQMSKEDFLSMLQANTIYCLNMLNYLSIHSQRSVNAIRLLNEGTLIQQVALWLSSITDVQSLYIEVICSKEDFCKLTNLTLESVNRDIEKMETMGIARYREGSLYIPVRTAFMEAAFPVIAGEDTIRDKVVAMSR